MGPLIRAILALYWSDLDMLDGFVENKESSELSSWVNPELVAQTSEPEIICIDESAIFRPWIRS